MASSLLNTIDEAYDRIKLYKAKRGVVKIDVEEFEKIRSSVRATRNYLAGYVTGYITGEE